MTLPRSVSYLFYGLVFENCELKQTLGYSFDIWLDEYLEKTCTKVMNEKDYWKEKSLLKKRLGIEVIFYDGEEDTNVGLAVKDSMFITCSGLADILNLDHLKKDKSWDKIVFDMIDLLNLGEEKLDKSKLKPNWYIVTKTEV